MYRFGNALYPVFRVKTICRRSNNLNFSGMLSCIHQRYSGKGRNSFRRIGELTDQLKTSEEIRDRLNKNYQLLQERHEAEMQNMRETSRKVAAC